MGTSLVRRLLLDELRLPLAAAKVSSELHRIDDGLIVRGRTRHASSTEVFAPSFDVELRPSLRQLAGHALLDDAMVVRSSRVLRGLSANAFEAQGVREQDRSVRAALFAACGSLGLAASVDGAGVLVGRVAPGGPADGRLVADDVVVAVDARPVRTADELFRALVAAGRRPVSLEVVRGLQEAGAGGVDTVLVTPDWSADRPSLGLVVETHQLAVHLPIDVSVRLDEGTAGPSAGLAIALSVVDALRPEPLSARWAIAATGTVDTLGNVGEVGGVAMKAKAVAAHPSVRTFLVPEANADEAREGAAGRLDIVAVASLAGALDALAALRND